MFNPIKETKHALNLNLDSQPTSPPSYKIEQIKKQVNKIAMLKSSSTSKSIKEVKKNNEFEKAYHQASMQNHPIINIENQSKEKFVHKKLELSQVYNIQYFSAMTPISLPRKFDSNRVNQNLSISPNQFQQKLFEFKPSDQKEYNFNFPLTPALKSKDPYDCVKTHISGYLNLSGDSEIPSCIKKLENSEISFPEIKSTNIVKHRFRSPGPFKSPNKCSQNSIKLIKHAYLSNSKISGILRSQLSIDKMLSSPSKHRNSNSSISKILIKSCRPRKVCRKVITVDELQDLL